MKKEAKYIEQQRYRKWDVLGLLTFFLIYSVIRFVDGILTENSFLISISLLSFTISSVILIYLFSIRLILKIDDQKISFRYHPLHLKKYKIKWDEVEDYQIVHTPISAEYSGWAVRYARGDGEQMFSVSGRRGIWLQLKDGRRFFIGSKHLNELREALTRYGVRES